MIICKYKILSDVLNAQNQGTAKNGLSASFSGTSGTVSVSGGNHTHKVDLAKSNWGGTSGDTNMLDASQHTSATYNNKTPLQYSGDLSMSGTFKPSGTVSLTGNLETRPVNYSMRIWKRIS